MDATTVLFDGDLTIRVEAKRVAARFDNVN
jgi:hypothetical protein